MAEKTISDVAREGGNARASALTKEERSEIARGAVQTRWRRAGRLKGEPKRATHTGELRFSEDATFPCAVLDDGTRVLSQRGFSKGMGGSKPTSMTRRGAGKLPAILSAANLKPFIDHELEVTANPVEYITSEGQLAIGIRAEAVPEMCKVWLRARDAGVLRHNQEHFAVRADLIIRGMATVGIVALVDEATGYQDIRARDALARILEAYVRKELRKWVRTFELDFYRELFRLKGLPFNGTVQSPPYVGHIINDIIYTRLAPGVLTALKKKNPVTESGRRKHRLFQYLTTDIGHPKLKELLASVTTIMKMSPDWDAFYSWLNRIHPPHTPLPLWEVAGALPE